MNKTLTGVTIKNADRGEVEAVFSTFGVVDHDMDVVEKGAFTEGARVVISAYGHKSHVGELPVGFGTIHEDGDRAILKGQFLMDTVHGRDTFATIKALSEQGLQEWSYSLDDVKARRGQVDGKSVRIIEAVRVKEVSPVLQGASIGTQTLGVKQSKQLAYTVARLLSEAGQARWERSRSYVTLDDFDVDASTAIFCVTDYSMEPRERYRVMVDFTRTDTAVTLGEVETPVEYTTIYMPKGTKFSELKSAALGGVAGLVDTAVGRLALRVAEGKSITEQVEAYDEAIAALEPLRKAIAAHSQPPHSEQASAAVELELARAGLLLSTHL